MEQILEQFGVKPLLLAAQVVNFLILLFILKRYLYKPILAILEKRKEMIAQSLKNAEEIEKKLLETEEDKENALIKASQEAKETIEEATKSASQIIEEAHTKAAIDIEQMIKKGEEQIKQEREKMQQELKSELADIVSLALEKVTGKVVNAKDQKELIEKSIKEL